MLMREALQTDIYPAHEEYATMPIQDAFEWSQAVRDFERTRNTNLRTGSTVLSVYSFRSILEPGVDFQEVGDSDDKTYQAVLSSPLRDNLYAYFRGERNEDGSWKQHEEGAVNLSTCVWDNERAAFLSLHGPDAAQHRHSAGNAPRWYGRNWSLDIHSMIPHDDGVVFVEHDNPHALKHKRGTELYARTIGAKIWAASSSSYLPA